MNNGVVDGVLAEVERSLDAFLTAHAHSASLQHLDSLPQPALSSEWKHLDGSNQSSAHGEVGFHHDLAQLEWMCAFAGSRVLDPVVQHILNWIQVVELRAVTSASSQASVQPGEAPVTSVFGKRFGSWIAARLLVVVFDAAELPAAGAEADQMASAVLDRCFKVFEIEHQVELKRSQHGSGGFFSVFMSSVPALKSSSHIPMPSSPSESDTAVESDACIQRHALGQWRFVLGRAARLSPRVTRAKLQREMAKPGLVANVSKTSVSQLSSFHGDAGGGAIPHPYLQFLPELPLSLVGGAGNSGQRLKDAALLLKLFFPLFGKPFKSRARRGAAILVANLLRRERGAMNRDQFKNLLAFAPVSEWNSCVSELHAIALKLSQKRKTLAAGWELRASILALAPSDIFGRYWKDDMHALLRLQYRYSKDGGSISINNVGASGGSATVGSADSAAGTILRCVGVSFTNFVLRHLLAERRGGSPTESDCMEVINTAQAWCFFSSHRQKSFARFLTSVVPVLIELSVAIAAFNMRYAIQSHVRRLLTEADSVVDDKKLVGLKVLLVLCRNCSASESPSEIDAATKPIDFALDAQMFTGQVGALGEIVGHILISCNTLLGHDLLFDQLSSMTSTPLSVSLTADQALASNATTRLLRDENKRLLAVEIFATALRMLEFVYNDLELRSDQKVLLLERASVHSDATIRASATETLLAVTASDKFAQAGAILRGLTDYLVRMTSNHAQANDAEPLKLLVRLCGSLLRAATHASFRPGATTSCWEDESTVRESFLQVEAAAVFLLTHDEAAVRFAAVETLEEIQGMRAMIASCSGSQSKEEPETLESVSAVDVISALEPALKERFFTFQPLAAENESCTSEENLDGDKLWYFRRLAGDWGDARHGFRWSMCLASVFPALATELPQLMTYFWTDANDKVSKLEPVIATFSDEHIPRFSSGGGNISRWRNLSIFATSSAYRTLVLATPSTMSKSTSSPINPSSVSCPTAQSAISSSAIAALLKRLARYLKSASVEQQKAAIVALGATHRSSHVLLVDVLSKCEVDAFSEVPQDPVSSSKSSSRTDSFEALVRPVPQQSSEMASSGSVSRRYSKSANKARSSRATTQLQTQWALSRCHRLLLESVFSNGSSLSTSANGEKGADATVHASDDELLMSASSSFLVRMANALDLLCSSAASTDRVARGTSALLAEAGGHMLFMIQQDFCGAVQLLLKHLMKLDRGIQRAVDSKNNNQEDGISLTDEEERPEHHETTAERVAISSFVNEARAAQWTKSLLGWCASFSSLADPAMADHLDGTFFAASSPLYDAWIGLCDVFGIRERESGQTLPWLWLDEVVPVCIKSSANQDASSRRHGQRSVFVVTSSTRFLRFFTCHCAFSTLTTLIDRSRCHFLAVDLATSSSPIISWLDECFAVDTTRSAAHFSSLQRLGQAAAKRFLDIDRNGVFRSICIEKSCFRRSSGAGHAIAKQYMLALSTQAHRISVELLNASNNAASCTTTDATTVISCSSLPQASGRVQLMYAMLLHLGAAADPNDLAANDLHRAKIRSFLGAILPRDNSDNEQTSRWLGSLAVTAPHCSTVLATEVRSSVQVAAASALASSFPGLRFAVCIAAINLLGRCDAFIQRSMLGAVLPLLVDTKAAVLPSHSGRPEIELTTNDVVDHTSIDALLELMFKLTTSISDTCAEQLVRVWLTLAYSSTSTPIEASLLVIVRFLITKCESPAGTATARLILWWLARWQDAAFSVVSVLCSYVETQRLPRSPSIKDLPENPTDASAIAAAATKATSLDGIAMFVTLVSDASCHLQQSATRAFKEVVLQTVHFALLLHFATSSSSSPGGTTSYCNGVYIRPLPLTGSDSELQLEDTPVAKPQTGSVVSTDIHRDSVVLLQTMTHFLSSVSTADALVTAVDAITSCVDRQTADNSNRCSTVELSTGQDQAEVDFGVGDTSKRLLEGLMALTQSLSTDDAAVWSELCVKEIALVLSNAMSSQPTSKLTASATIEARFAVLMYGFLAPTFNGDVFLAVLELLHVALDEHLRDPTAFEPLICDCLALLARMVERMPDSKLALYPQVLWVCTALLNHFTTPIAREATLKLLHSLLHKPMLVTNEILADVIICKRPAQWSPDQSSVLRALVSSLHIGAQRARRMAIEMVMQCTLLLPQTLLVVTEIERVILCSVGLLPALTAGARQSFCSIVPAEVLKSACNDLAAQWESLAAQIGSASAVKTPQDVCEEILSVAKFFQERAKHYAQPRAAGGPKSLRASSARSSVESVASPGSFAREAIMSFVHAFVPAVTVLKHRGKPTVDGLALTFDVMTRTLSSIDASLSADAPTNCINDGVTAIMAQMDADAFILAEELLLTMEAVGVRWRPPPTFAAALSRIARQPQRRSAWKSAVRLLTYLSMEKAPLRCLSLPHQRDP